MKRSFAIFNRQQDKVLLKLHKGFSSCNILDLVTVFDQFKNGIDRTN